MFVKGGMEAGMIGLMIASVPIDGDVSIWAQWGLAGVVVAYTMYRDWQREKTLTKKLEEHEKYMRDMLFGALERNTKAIERNTLALDGKPRFAP